MFLFWSVLSFLSLPLLELIYSVVSGRFLFLIVFPISKPQRNNDWGGVFFTSWIYARDWETCNSRFPPLGKSLV